MSETKQIEIAQAQQVVPMEIIEKAKGDVTADVQAVLEAKIRAFMDAEGYELLEMGTCSYYEGKAAVDEDTLVPVRIYTLEAKGTRR